MTQGTRHIIGVSCVAMLLVLMGFVPASARDDLYFPPDEEDWETVAPEAAGSCIRPTRFPLLSLELASRF